SSPRLVYRACRSYRPRFPADAVAQPRQPAMPDDPHVPLGDGELLRNLFRRSFRIEGEEQDRALPLRPSLEARLHSMLKRSERSVRSRSSNRLEQVRSRLIRTEREVRPESVEDPRSALLGPALVDHHLPAGSEDEGDEPLRVAQSPRAKALERLEHH